MYYVFERKQLKERNDDYVIHVTIIHVIINMDWVR